MSGDQAIGAITLVCALILVGSGIVRRRMAPQSMIVLVAFWGAAIVLGVALAKLWLAHHVWPQ